MVRVRLAPSPTGTLHIGTARTAVFNWLYARKEGGSFLLRIEDTDKERSKPEFTRNILEGLQWLGIDWDEDPVIQSERVDQHRAAIQTLLENGLAYRCYASEEELEAMREAQKASNQAPRYDNRHRNLTPEQEAAFQAEGREAVIRFKIDDDAEILWKDLVRGPMRWRGADLGGDMVVARRAPADQVGDPLYNLVVVVDDAAMAITHVIRGEDHIANTAKQLLLYEALGLAKPTFAHAPLILNAEGRKLSKRDGVTSINDFRSMGYTAEAIANYMTCWAGPYRKEWRNAPTNRQRRCSASIASTKLEPASTGQTQLAEWSGAVLCRQSSSPGRDAAVDIRGMVAARGSELGSGLCELLGPSLTLIKDSVEQASPFFVCPDLEDDGVKQLAVEGAKTAISHLLTALEAKPWDGLDTSKAQRCSATLEGRASRRG